MTRLFAPFLSVIAKPSTDGSSKGNMLFYKVILIFPGRYRLAMPRSVRLALQNPPTSALLSSYPRQSPRPRSGGSAAANRGPGSRGGEASSACGPRLAERRRCRGDPSRSRCLEGKREPLEETDQKIYIRRNRYLFIFML